MRKGILLLMVLAFAAMLVAGCGGGEEQQEPPQKTEMPDTTQKSKPVEMKMEGQMPDSAAMHDSAAAMEDTAQAMMKGQKGGGH